MKRKNRLDEASHSGGRHRMANHRFHAAERAVCNALPLPKYASERFNFDRIAYERARAVRLD